MLVSMDWLLLTRIVRLHLGGDQYITQQSMWHCELLLRKSMESNSTITAQNVIKSSWYSIISLKPIIMKRIENRLVAKAVLRV